MDDILQNAVDSIEYHVLEHACTHVCSHNLTGMTCEIGVREGGSSHMIMRVFANNKMPRPHIALDPYGDIMYRGADGIGGRIGYDNTMKNKAFVNLYAWCYEYNYPLIFLPLEDTEFFTRFANGVPIYNESKHICNEYSLVFFDGPHTTQDVLNEIMFFIPRLQRKGVFVFDDIHHYKHKEVVDPMLQANGFRVLQEATRKISYVKM